MYLLYKYIVVIIMTAFDTIRGLAPYRSINTEPLQAGSGLDFSAYYTRKLLCDKQKFDLEVEPSYCLMINTSV